MKDTLTQTIGVLLRREVEARMLAPVIDALGEEFGRDKVVEIVSKTIVELARQQGADLADQLGDDVAAFQESLKYWTQNDALKIDVLATTDTQLEFNVTRCRYAEMYRALGIAELGKTLSCNRDYALIEGFNPDASLTRDQTILSGADCCTFRYQFPAKKT